MDRHGGVSEKRIWSWTVGLNPYLAIFHLCPYICYIPFWDLVSPTLEVHQYYLYHRTTVRTSKTITEVFSTEPSAQWLLTTTTIIITGLGTEHCAGGVAKPAFIKGQLFICILSNLYSHPRGRCYDYAVCLQ